MNRLRTTALMVMAAALLLMSCKTVETRSEAPVAPQATVVKNVKIMVPGAD